MLKVSEIMGPTLIEKKDEFVHIIFQETNENKIGVNVNVYDAGDKEFAYAFTIFDRGDIIALGAFKHLDETKLNLPSLPNPDEPYPIVRLTRDYWTKVTADRNKIEFFSDDGNVLKVSIFDDGSAKGIKNITIVLNESKVSLQHLR